MRLDKNRVANLVDASYGQRMLEEGDRAQAGNPEKEQIWLLLLTEIEPDPDQPRRHIEETSLQELAADIARRGVLQPILVRPYEGRYRIVFGERRWRASQIAGKSRIPCIVREMEPQAVQQAQLVENILREGISDIERGLGLRRLYETLKTEDRKTTWEHVAQMVGITRMRINHLYSLSFLPESIIEMIQTKRLSGSHGVELARLEKHPETQTLLAEEACRQNKGSGAYGLSVSQLRHRVSVVLGMSRPTRKSSLSPDMILERSLEIQNALRPGLSEAVCSQLKETAQTILRFLEQPPPEDSPDKPDKSVKSTLQNSTGEEGGDDLKPRKTTNKKSGAHE